MKILYAIQATGNGHISRALQLLPSLRQYGKVDLFLSGANSQLKMDVPVKFRSRGLSLFYNQGGGLDYLKILKTANPVHVWDEVRDLPVEKYDVVINDFECLTSLACAYKRVPSVNFGHQASFRSPLVPRPAKKDPAGSFILRHYARATQYVGLHFKRYDDFIFTPVIKSEVLQARPANQGHITVYLSAYSDETLLGYFRQLPAFRFQVFSKQVSRPLTQDNVSFIPVNDRLFTESMINSAGVITGAGFETPAEALQLGKKLLCIPIRGQYEQACNAAALEQLGVRVLARLDRDFTTDFESWQAYQGQQQVEYGPVIPEVLSYLFNNYPYPGNTQDLVYPGLIFN